MMQLFRFVIYLVCMHKMVRNWSCLCCPHLHKGARCDDYQASEQGVVIFKLLQTPAKNIVTFFASEMLEMLMIAKDIPLNKTYRLQ